MADQSMRKQKLRQLHCLLADTTDKQNNISDHCEKWNKCLSKEPTRKKKLKTVLKAGLGTSKSLSENENQYRRRRRRKHTSCMDPANEDAESFECECLADVSEDCADDDEDCYRRFFCASSKVCDSWKGENCASSLMAKENASAFVRREARDDSADGAHLDSALEGKCKG